MHAVGAHLQLSRHLAQTLQARVGEGGQGSFGLVAAHGQLSAQGACEHLLRRLERVQWHLLENPRCAWIVFLLVSQVGSAQAQQGCVLGRLAGGCLVEQLLDTGVRGAREFAQAG